MYIYVSEYGKKQQSLEGIRKIIIHSKTRERERTSLIQKRKESKRMHPNILDKNIYASTPDKKRKKYVHGIHIYDDFMKKRERKKWCVNDNNI